MNCYPLLDCASSPTETVQIVIHGAADKSDTDGSSPTKIVNPTSMKEDKQARKRPKTQGDLRQDVQETHLEVLSMEKEKMGIETGNLLLKRRKLELQVQLLERKVLNLPKDVNEPFDCPHSPIF